MGRSKVKVPHDEWRLIKDARGLFPEKAREQLFQRYKGLIGGIVINCLKTGLREEFDDLFQKGCMGLLQAINKFRLRKKSSFRTYAAYWIKSYVTGIEKEGSPHKKPHGETTLSLDEGPDDVGENQYNLIPSPEPNIEGILTGESFLDKEPWLTVEAAVADLPTRLKEVLRLRYDEDLTLAEAGARMGITKERARQLEARALRILRGKCGRRSEGHAAA